MNLPNRLSLLRICLIPFFVVFALMPALWAQMVALALFIGASVTDLLDGRIARKHGLVTNFGKFIDPIADKLLVMAAFVVLTGQGRIPSWMCIIILAREFAISGLRQVAADAGKVIAAGPLGKIKTVTQMSAIIGMFFFVPLEGAPIHGQIGVILAQIALYLAVVMTLWSGVDYIVRNFDCIRDM